MATLTVQTITEAGVSPTYATASSGGDKFPNARGDTYLHVKNGGASAITVTIEAQTTSRVIAGFGTVTKSDGGGSVAAGGEKIFGPFPIAAFNDTSGDVSVTYDDTTSVTVGAFRLAQPGE